MSKIKPSKPYSKGWHFGLRKGEYCHTAITEEFGNGEYVVVGELLDDFTRVELYHLFKDLKAFIKAKQRVRRL